MPRTTKQSSNSLLCVGKGKIEVAKTQKFNNNDNDKNGIVKQIQPALWYGRARVLLFTQQRQCVIFSQVTGNIVCVVFFLDAAFFRCFFIVFSPLCVRRTPPSCWFVGVCFFSFHFFSFRYC